MRDDDATWPQYRVWDDPTELLPTALRAIEEPTIDEMTLESVRALRARPRFPLALILGAFVMTTLLSAAGTLVLESARASPPPCPTTTQPAQ